MIDMVAVAIAIIPKTLLQRVAKPKGYRTQE